MWTALLYMSFILVSNTLYLLQSLFNTNSNRLWALHSNLLPNLWTSICCLCMSRPNTCSQSTMTNSAGGSKSPNLLNSTSNPLSSITWFCNEDQLHSSGKNSIPWKKLQTILFIALNLYDIVSGSTPQPAAMPKDYEQLYAHKKQEWEVKCTGANDGNQKGIKGHNRWGIAVWESLVSLSG